MASRFLNHKRASNTLLVAPAGVLFYSLIGEPTSFNTLYMLARPRMTFIDVGASISSYAIPMAERGLNVIAIEPDILSAMLLKVNAALNGQK